MFFFEYNMGFDFYFNGIDWNKVCVVFFGVWLVVLFLNFIWWFRILFFVFEFLFLDFKLVYGYSFSFYGNI